MYLIPIFIIHTPVMDPCVLIRICGVVDTFAIEDFVAGAVGRSGTRLPQPAAGARLGENVAPA